jgi:phenylpropionate dioxygenase-like ring-hydroxylating dioxygenase large terminal subunit
MNAIDLVTPNRLMDDERSGLPPWTYFNNELVHIEQDELFRRHWQLACHVSDIPKDGDWTTFDIASERALIVRGKDNVVRAFHNV